jgi:hypothetical protein
VCQTGLKSNEQHTFKKVQVVLGELFLGALLTHGASLLFSLFPEKSGIFIRDSSTRAFIIYDI